MREDVSKRVVSEDFKLDKEKKYWLNKLSGELVKSIFPYDYITGTGTCGERSGVEFYIPRDLSHRLIGLSNHSSLNLYLVLMAVVAVLLYKYTGNNDIIVVAPIYKQKLEGEFINTVLAIRNQLEEKTTFKELLLQIKNNLKEANEHLNYPLESLLYHLDIPAADKGFPLSETVILLQNIHRREYVEDITPNILFSFLETGEIIKGNLEYNPGLYRKETIKRLIIHYTHLLRESTQNFEIPLKNIKILSKEEQQELLVKFNNTGKEYPREKTIHQLFAAQVERTPGHTALIGKNPEQEGTGGLTPLYITYRGLNEKANQLARFLRQKGVEKDTIAAVMIDPSVEIIIAILALLKAGGAYLPIEPEYLANRTIYMLKDSQVRLLLTRTHLISRVEFWGETIDLDDLSLYQGNEGNLPDKISPDALLYMIYTSGTSGKPKGVLIKNQNLVNYITWVSETLGLGPRDKTILTSSFAFDLGYTSLYSSILNGGQLHILSLATYLLPRKLLNYIKENAISYLKITPSFFSLLVNNPGFSLEIGSTLKYIILGGEAINTTDVEQAYKICNHLRIMNHYGPTETTIGSIAQFIDFNRYEEYKKVPTIGKPIFNTTVYILDKFLQPVPGGVPGELCIGGDNVGLGYLNRPELTAEKFRPGFYRSYRSYIYRTGDLAKWLSNGNIQFLGRLDSQLKIRGYRIEPGEIENQLLKHEAVTEAVVVSAANENKEKYLCAYIVLAKPFEIPELKSMLLKNLPDYMIPRYFVPIDKIPLTPNGKVDRKSLPQPETGIFVKEYTAPTDEVEENLVRIWSEVLGIEKEKIGTEHNFFELGGHSLNLVMLISNIYKEFAVEVSINQIFQRPIIKEISKYVKSTRSAEEPMVLLNQPTQNKLFCFPPGIAYGIAYRDLASIITDYSFYSFSFIEDEDRLEKYVDIITGLQSEGPYVLFGYSAAGKLIFKVTKALENQGCQVSDIVLIDSFLTEEEDEEKMFEEHREFIEMIEKNMEELGIGFLKEKVKKKMKEYLMYNRSLTQPEVVHANVHLIISEEKREDMSGCWDKFTTKGTMIYQGCGQHSDMFLPDFLERNAEITRKILYKISSRRKTI